MELKNENNENNEIKLKRNRKKKFTEEEIKQRQAQHKKKHFQQNREHYYNLNRNSYKERMEKLTKEEKPYNQKIQCICGAIMNKSNKYKHLKTLIHLKNMQTKPKYEVELICGNAEDLEKMGYVVS